MAGRHRERAQENSTTPAEDSIGEEAAKDRCEINAGGVGTEDCGSERLAADPAIEAAETVKRDDVLDAAGQEEILDHVKDEQRLHAVEGKALPRLGEGEIPEPAWMAQ